MTLAINADPRFDIAGDLARQAREKLAKQAAERADKRLRAAARARLYGPLVEAIESLFEHDMEFTGDYDYVELVPHELYDDRLKWRLREEGEAYGDVLFEIRVSSDCDGSPYITVESGRFCEKKHFCNWPAAYEHCVGRIIERLTPESLKAWGRRD